MNSEIGCPMCNEPMVERINKATREPFLGCSRFPACKGSRDMEDMDDMDGCDYNDSDDGQDGDDWGWAPLPTL